MLRRHGAFPVARTQNVRMNTGVLPVPVVPELMRDRDRLDGVATVQKALQLLEAIADRGSSTARELSASLGIPLPTVYRLAQELVKRGYLVHLKAEYKFELGYKLYGLGVSLHRQIAASSEVRAAIDELHNTVEMAAYFAIYRGADMVVTYVSDCAEHRRLSPLKFGFHEAAHATAFGKIMLAGMSIEQRDEYLQVHGTPQLADATIADRATLEDVLAKVALRGVAWEREEFMPGKSCAAVGVRDASGLITGAVAISMDADAIDGSEERQVEVRLREYAGLISRYYRAESNSLALS